MQKLKLTIVLNVEENYNLKRKNETHKKREYVTDLMDKAVDHCFNKLKEQIYTMRTKTDMYRFHNKKSKKEFIKAIEIDTGLTVKDLATGNFDYQWCEVIKES